MAFMFAFDPKRESSVGKVDPRETKSLAIEGTRDSSEDCLEGPDLSAAGSMDWRMTVAGWRASSEPSSRRSDPDCARSDPLERGLQRISVSSEGWPEAG